MTSLIIDKEYSFTTLFPSILNAKYEDYLFQGTCNHVIASDYTDIQKLFTDIKSVCDVNSPLKNLDISALNWLLFRETNGTVVVLAKEWIDMNSINTSISELTLKMKNVTSKNKNSIAFVLKQIGVTDIEWL